MVAKKYITRDDLKTKYNKFLTEFIQGNRHNYHLQFGIILAHIASNNINCMSMPRLVHFVFKLMAVATENNEHFLKFFLRTLSPRLRAQFIFLSIAMMSV